jgi:hypothetical protein
MKGDVQRRQRKTTRHAEEKDSKHDEISEFGIAHTRHGYAVDVDGKEGEE